MNKIQNFQDLKVWQRSHELVLAIYKITKNFPIDEKFGLTNQIRRAVVSIISNIAEGFPRKSCKEKIQFYYIALSSLSEIENQLLIAKDLNYISKEIFKKLEGIIIEIQKMLNSVIKKLNT